MKVVVVMQVKMYRGEVAAQSGKVGEKEYCRCKG